MPDDGVSYYVVDSTVITSKISANESDNNADLCVLPVNVAAKRLGSGDEYQMLGLVTQGNMYLISNKDVAAVETLSALKGETVGLAQIANVPGLTLKAALNRGGLANNGGVDGTLSYYLAAEPFVTTMTWSGKFRVVGDLQALYNGADSENKGYPQAVLVAKRSFLDKNKAWTENLLSKLENGNAWLQQANEQDIYMSIVRHFEDSSHKPTFNLGVLTKDCISRCGISFAYAKDCSARVDEFLTELQTVNANMASTVEKDFYWLG